jgi:hypothetical protein
VSVDPGPALWSPPDEGRGAMGRARGGRGARWRLLLAMLLGLATAAAIVPVTWWSMKGLPITADHFVVRGAHVWTGLERRSAVVRWINLESVARLVNDRAPEGELPAWAEPPAPADERTVRFGAVAAGWPLPVVTGTWTAIQLTEYFPPLASNEDSGFAPRDALTRIFEGDPHATVRWHLGAFAADAVALAIGWFVAIELAWALRPRRRVTPQAGAEAPRG